MCCQHSLRHFLHDFSVLKHMCLLYSSCLFFTLLKKFTLHGWPCAAFSFFLLISFSFFFNMQLCRRELLCFEEEGLLDTGQFLARAIVQ